MGSPYRLSTISGWKSLITLELHLNSERLMPFSLCLMKLFTLTPCILTSSLTSPFQTRNLVWHLPSLLGWTNRSKWAVSPRGTASQALTDTAGAGCGSPPSPLILLRPLHDWAMGVLSHLRTDGTFHQTRPLLYQFCIRNWFSYDLKGRVGYSIVGRWYWVGLR